jgi:4-diphosphocytidyl-2-C-methyl-D-erythritol kinase
MIIREATHADLEQLQKIEYEANDLFAPYGYCELYRATMTPLVALEEHLAKHSAWVAAPSQSEPCVGFLLGTSYVQHGHVHIDELDVLPSFGRRGIGASLVKRAMQWAEELGASHVTLSTLRHVPFNAPFYAKLGFQIMGENIELTPPLQRVRDFERAHGWSADDRVLMALAL